MDERDKPGPGPAADPDDKDRKPADAPDGRPSRPVGPPEGDIRVIDRRWWARGSSEEDAGGDWSPRKPTYVEELEQRLAEKDEQLRTTLTRYREASSEFDEARARFRRDVGKEVERGKRAILVELLDVVDNLDRAIEAATGAARSDALIQGVELVRTQFLAKLDGFGVTRVDPTGHPFDPTRHEAATSVPTQDRARDGWIVGVIRQGYEIGGDVLRPAVVAVARYLE